MFQKYFLLIISFLYTLTIVAQVELGEVFEEGFVFCDFFEGSTGPKEVYLDESGIIFNLNESGKIKRLNKDLTVDHITSTYVEEIVNIGFGVTESKPSPSTTRFQRIDQNLKKLIITEDADLIGPFNPNSPCYNSDFQVYDFNNNNSISYQNIKYNLDTIGFSTRDVIYDHQETYYIYSKIDNASVCPYYGLQLVHFVRYNSTTEEIIYRSTDLDLVSFFKNQSHEIFFIAKENNQDYNLYKLKEDLSHIKLISDINYKTPLFTYGNNKILLVKNNSFEIFDESFTTLLSSFQYNTNNLTRIDVQNEDIYIYKAGKLTKLNSNFEESTIFESQEDLPIIQGIINNGEYTYLWGRIEGTSLYLKSINESELSLNCVPVDECSDIEIIEITPICMRYDTSYTYPGFQDPAYIYFTLYLTADIIIRNHDPIDLANIIVETYNPQTWLFVDEPNIMSSFILDSIKSNSINQITLDIVFKTKGKQLFFPDFEYEYAKITDSLEIYIKSADYLKACPHDPILLDPQTLLLVMDQDCDGYPEYEDCNDFDPLINPGAIEIPNNDIDENCDGLIEEIDEDLDGFNSDVDCDDYNYEINPNAEEIENNEVDENCDGLVYIDADADGFPSSEDCDDKNPHIYPGSSDIYLNSKSCNPKYNIGPNPVTDELYINSSELTSYYIITDLTGTVILTGTLLQEETIIDVSNLLKGIYIIRFFNYEYRFVKII